MSAFRQGPEPEPHGLRKLACVRYDPAEDVARKDDRSLFLQALFFAACGNLSHALEGVLASCPSPLRRVFRKEEEEEEEGDG